MTETRIGVVVAPSAQTGAWRQAIAARAGKLGFKLLKSVEDQDREGSYVLLCKGLSSVVVSDADTWIVIVGATSDLVAATMADLDGTPRDATRAVATQLAGLCDLVAAGARLYDADAASLTFEEFGTIVPRTRAEAARPAALPAPLTMFEHLPPRVGARAEWGADFFDYTVGQVPTGGSPQIDLTGRTRILVHGPLFDLPAGHWRITARFRVTPEDVAYLLFEWGVAGDVTSYHAELDVAGGYELALDHVWTHRGPAELRIWAERGHFLGRMVMGDCTVERLPDAA